MLNCPTTLPRPTLGTALAVEWRKLNRSLALVLAGVAPLLVAVFMFFDLLRSPHTFSWDGWMRTSAGIWAFFMLPMSVTALTALVAHMEHAPRSWDYLRALPCPRWHLYAAKALWIVGVVAGMSLLVFTATSAALHLGAHVRPDHAPTGYFAAWPMLVLFARIGLAALLMIAVQLWIALRFASFVPALAIGIAGTFFAVVAASAKIGIFLPWQMPVNMLASDLGRADLALLLGYVGGALAMVLMLVHLSRREVL